MTLCELIDVIDYNREYSTEIIQIIQPDSDWDEFVECPTNSVFLVPFYTAKIKSLDAVSEYVVRIEIDWKELDSRLHIFGWDKEDEDD